MGPMSAKFKPQLPSGFKDYPPEEEKARSEMLETIKRNFELFGFSPIDTPAIEEEKTLTGGDKEFKKQIFRIGKKRAGEELALRFDLTVPLARFMSMNAGTLTLPFKRYQVGKVWRGERPQAGRFREFLQFDADTVGSKSITADAEIVALINQVMVSLGFQNFLIRVNNRKILAGLPKYAGFPKDKLEDVLRAADKLDKIGASGVLAKLSSKAVGLSKKQARLAMDFFAAKDKKKIMNGDLQKGFAEMEELGTRIKSFGVPADRWTFDLATVRGLAYYTGFVFETILLDMPAVGSVFSGGRYDNLIKKLGGPDLPAVGVSVGVDRLFYAMKELGNSPGGKRQARVLVLNFDAKAIKEAAAAVSLLRKNGIASEIYLGNEKGLRDQVSYALKNNYEIAVIVGEQEASRGVVGVKNFTSYKQIEITSDNLVKTVQDMLA